MQRFTSTYLLPVLACAALLAPAAGVVNAAELGDVSARSFIGQPLAADIELVALAPEEVNALQVRLARPDVFRGANITMNPALSSVRMAVVKRDQKQFLHVTTTRPVDAEYVHVYVELSAAGRQDVRLATVWLQADPNPPPPTAPVAAAVPMPTAMTSADAERIAAQARAERAAASPAVPAAPPARDRSRPAPLPSVHESEIGVPGALKAAAASAPPRQASPVAVRDLASRIAEAMGTPRAASAPASTRASPSNAASVPAAAPASVAASASPPAPAKPAARRDAAAADSAVPLPVAQALLPLGPLPLPAGVKRAATPAACAPSGISAKECKALDTHSLALSSKLVELEGKMKALQGAIKGPAPAPAASAPAAAAPAAAPKAGQAGTVVLAAAGSSVAAAVATPAAADAPKSASAASATRVPAGAREAISAKAAEGKSSKPGKAGEAHAATMDGASASASAAAGAASASASADGQGANASASAAGASASAPVPLKRVLPKLKYKKEKPVERPINYVAWGAGVVGALLLAGAGLIYWRRKKSGAAPLKIWQGFRKKKPAGPADKPQQAKPLHEVTPESIMQ